jgi:23S rRNA pseudouridine1911/1915/1917 synthase
MSDQRFTIDASTAGCRLDRFLAHPERLGSRGRASAALERGKIFVNDAEATASDGGRPLEVGDRVRIWMDRPGSARTRTRPRSLEGRLEIVFEDEALIVVNKPAGLLVVPLPRRVDASVEEALVAYLRPRGRRRPFVVHRIDRDTSGLVVFATRASWQQALKDQFRRHTAERTYLAVVYGHPSPARGVWRDHLAWDARALIQKATSPTDPHAKAAESEYRVLESFRDSALIEVKLKTGKRNQIRLQARLRGHTLVGEQRYVFGPDELRPIAFPRQALHAHRLAFRHPVDGRRVEFQADMPFDMAALVERLRAEGPRSARPTRP